MTGFTSLLKSIAALAAVLSASFLGVSSLAAHIPAQATVKQPAIAKVALRRLVSREALALATITLSSSTLPFAKVESLSLPVFIIATIIDTIPAVFAEC